MKITSIDITGVGGIRKLSLGFNDRFNVICGPNGVGKTTLLESISHAFIYDQSNILHRNVNHEKGTIVVDFAHLEETKQSTIEIKNYQADKPEQILSNVHAFSNYILPIKIARYLDYQKMTGIARDPDKTGVTSRKDAISGIKFADVKTWLVNRHLFFHTGDLNRVQISNLETAKQSFSLLRSDVKFKKVNPSTYDIILSSDDGDILFEYLSAGFKSCLSMVLGIIKEIEYRFGSEDLSVKDFEGVILIDELELHLHPSWQSKVRKILLDSFPAAQIIATTHSPHLIQSCDPNEVIALKANEAATESEVIQVGEYGFKGWTVEEILMDVMGMESTRNELYKNKISAFSRVLDEENFDAADAIIEDLEGMLHPNNPNVKLLRLQIAAELARND